MKRFSVLLSVLTFTLVLTFVSCKKEKVITNDPLVSNEQIAGLNFKVKVENDMLFFETIKDYEAAIDYVTKLADSSNLEKWKEDIDFVSLYNNYELNFEECPIKSDVFASLLNKDLKVRIGNFEFTLDLAKENVIAKDLDGQKFEGEMNFGFEESIIDYIFYNIPDSKACNQCLYCDDEYTKSTTEGDVFMEIEYNRYGIYYELEYDWDKDGTAWFVVPYISMYNISGSYSQCGSDKLIDYSNAGQKSHHNNYYIRIYSSGTRLDIIHAYGKFKVEEKNSLGQYYATFDSNFQIYCH